MKKRTKAQELAELERQLEQQTSQQAATPRKARVSQPSVSEQAPLSKSEPTEQPTRTKGKKIISFALYESEQQKIHDLDGWLRAQGEKPSESNIGAAAIHMAKPGPEFLRIYREIRALDRRGKKKTS